jgi:SCP-2 sterol transfer family
MLALPSAGSASSKGGRRPGWVNPTRTRRLTATFEVHLRGQATHVVAFRDGHLQVNPTGRRVDVHISADPAAFLLVLDRRQPQWRHIAAGRLLAWGRKPWLALTFADCFQQP